MALHAVCRADITANPLASDQPPTARPQHDPLRLIMGNFGGVSHTFLTHLSWRSPFIKELTAQHNASGGHRVPAVGIAVRPRSWVFTT
jgi:hypothetical protein